MSSVTYISTKKVVPNQPALLTIDRQGICNKSPFVLIIMFQEKDSAVEMWHMALREVENLEEALKSYQDNRHLDLAQRKTEDVRWVSMTYFIT